MLMMTRSYHRCTIEALVSHGIHNPVAVAGIKETHRTQNKNLTMKTRLEKREKKGVDELLSEPTSPKTKKR